MTCLLKCPCGLGKYTLQNLRFLGMKEQNVKVGVLDESPLYETVEWYIFQTVCLLCGRTVKFKGQTEDDSMDQILDLILPYSARWILPEEIDLKPRLPEHKAP